ncbi:MAG: hypothetical protein HXX80_06730 [Nitrososphaerales archaeon]|nr:hypothetical protein [Nitrososphaerales archaeon]
MVYLGRVVAIGRTKEGRPCCAYAVSGRSRSSRMRRAILHHKRVAIEPLIGVQEGQGDQASLIFYDCITYNDYPPLIVIGNGNQVNSIFDLFSSEESSVKNMREILKELGPEPDSYHTPRIAGAIWKPSKDSPWRYCVGMITSEDFDVKIITIPKNRLVYLSTYTGDELEPKAPKFDSIDDILKEIDLEGSSAGDFADSMFDWMDHKFIVCTASAVWMNDRWELAVRNR